MHALRYVYKESTRAINPLKNSSACCFDRVPFGARGFAFPSIGISKPAPRFSSAGPVVQVQVSPTSLSKVEVWGSGSSWEISFVSFVSGVRAHEWSSVCLRIGVVHPTPCCCSCWPLTMSCMLLKEFATTASGFPRLPKGSQGLSKASQNRFNNQLSYKQMYKMGPEKCSWGLGISGWIKTALRIHGNASCIAFCIFPLVRGSPLPTNEGVGVAVAFCTDPSHDYRIFEKCWPQT